MGGKQQNWEETALFIGGRGKGHVKNNSSEEKVTCIFGDSETSDWEVVTE